MSVKKNKSGQLSLIDMAGLDDSVMDAEWEKEWKGMPEFELENLQPFKSIIVHFNSREDMEKFSKLIEQNITSMTRSLWYPKAEFDLVKGIGWFDKNQPVPTISEILPKKKENKK